MAVAAPISVSATVAALERLNVDEVIVPLPVASTWQVVDFGGQSDCVYAVEAMMQKMQKTSNLIRMGNIVAWDFNDR